MRNYITGCKTELLTGFAPDYSFMNNLGYSCLTDVFRMKRQFLNETPEAEMAEYK